MKVTSIVASRDDHTFYMTDFGPVIRRLDPWNGRVVTVLDLSRALETVGITRRGFSKSFVVGADRTVYAVGLLW